MNNFISENNRLDTLHLYKFSAAQKIKTVLDYVANQASSEGLKKYASAEDRDGQLIELFIKMLSSLDLKMSKDSSQTLNDLVRNAKIDKSNSNSAERSESIKIASKQIKDSHYQIDVSKDEINHKGQRVFMVSCYARDSYLGRYLIKRNFYYPSNREKMADSAYEEIMTKMAQVKDRYYEGLIDPPAISAQFRTILDGVISEIEFDDGHGTTLRQ